MRSPKSYLHFESEKDHCMSRTLQQRKLLTVFLMKLPEDLGEVTLKKTANHP